MSKDERKPTIIKNPPKSWWPGDDRVEKYMPPVIQAITRHLPWPSQEATDIYNRAYEAVYQAIMEYGGDAKTKSKEVQAAVKKFIHNRRNQDET